MVRSLVEVVVIYPDGKVTGKTPGPIGNLEENHKNPRGPIVSSNLSTINSTVAGSCKPTNPAMKPAPGLAMGHRSFCAMLSGNL